MATIKVYTDFRYQIYSLKRNGDLDKPITIPILTRERANKYLVIVFNVPLFLLTNMVLSLKLLIKI